MALLYFTNFTTCSAISDAFDSASHAQWTRMLQGTWSAHTLLNWGGGGTTRGMGGTEHHRYRLCLAVLIEHFDVQHMTGLIYGRSGLDIDLTGDIVHHRIAEFPPPSVPRSP